MSTFGDVKAAADRQMMPMEPPLAEKTRGLEISSGPGRTGDRGWLALNSSKGRQCQ